MVFIQKEKNNPTDVSSIEQLNYMDTVDKEESDVSVYRDVSDNRIHLVYSEDDFPGCDRNLMYVDDYEDKYFQGWTGSGHWMIPIRKVTTEQVKIIYRDFDLTNIQTGINVKTNMLFAFELTQNYPNPLNPATTIKYTVPGRQITMTVYNVFGQKIKTLVDKVLSPGFYQVIWDGTNDGGDMVATVIYLCRLKTEAGAKTIKMSLQK